MKISIVTISYNQAEFLERAIVSVLAQDDADVEYIVVDPGSTDGSRAIIEQYRERIDHVILTPDDGPADGLNKGFALASGVIFGFLNADDELLPGALHKVAETFEARPGMDVLSGHALIVDKAGAVIRKAYSDRFTLRRAPYSGCVLLQASTFFRRKMFEQVGGFNPNNHAAWDDEVFWSMGLAGAKFGRINEILSAYRIYAESITGGEKRMEERLAYRQYRFRQLTGRDRNKRDSVLRFYYRVLRLLTNPRDAYQRLRFGPIAGRFRKEE